MRSFCGLLAAALIAILSTAASASAAAPSVGVTEADARFPFRSYVLTLSDGFAATAASVHVTENGVPVHDVTLTPASVAKSGTFAVVLVVDASNSMQGRSISAAVAAAREFAGHRIPTQKLGLLTFNSAVHTALRLTTSKKRIDAALSRTPTLAQGTHIYSAVLVAVRMLQRAGISSGSVVLLSDGADTGSPESDSVVAAAAQKAHVRVFTVGIRSSAFDPAALQRLAAQTGGSFSAASSRAQLEQIYNVLGKRLSAEYLLQYQSQAGPDKPVTVKIAVDGAGSPTVSGYRTPALPLASTPPFHPSLSYRVWRSGLAMVAIAILCALLIAFALWAVLRPAPSGLQQRVSNFVSLYTPEADPRRSDVSVDPRAGTAGEPDRPSRWQTLEAELEIAGVNASAGQIVFGTVAGTVVLVFVLAELFHAGIFSAIGLLVPLFVYNVLKSKLDRKRRLFGDQLPDALQVVASALRAGHTMVSALAVVSTESPEPTNSELRRAVADEQLGVPIDIALGRVATRMKSQEFEQVAIAAGLQREAGGNMAEVLDRVAEAVRERVELRQLVRSLTAQGRLSRWILTLLPLGLAGVIFVLDPGYLSPLIDTLVGRVIVLVAGIMIVIGSLTIKRIVEIRI